jgi:hypothetical protein
MASRSWSPSLVESRPQQHDREVRMSAVRGLVILTGCGRRAGASPTRPLAARPSGRPGRGRHPVVVVVAVVVSLAMLAGPAVAQQQGVAIDVGRIDVDEQLAAGERYQLPTIGVRNPGTAPTDYRMAVQPITGADTPDEAWFSFSPASFSLDPDARQPVEIVLELPADAPGGDYGALISAQVVAEGEGARVGAAAAARLTFSVPATPQPVSAPPAAPDDPSGFPWLLLLLALLLLLLLAWLIRTVRRYDIRIVRRR